MTPPEDPIAEDAYDAIADEYAEDVPTNAYNAQLEMPATRDLIPDVSGKRVLDAGCGTGIYTEWLLERGASEVVGVDASEEMLAKAREALADHPEYGDRGSFHHANLAEPLEFLADDAFEGIVSALVLGYVEDWRPTFAEFARVLAPGGFLVFSVGHPMDQIDEDDETANYFEIERQVKNWSVDVPYYRRPLAEMVNPLLEAGFSLDRIVEPQPTEAFAEKMSERYEKEMRWPVFLCVRALNR